MKNTVINNNFSKFAQDLKAKAKIEIDEELLAKRTPFFIYMIFEITSKNKVAPLPSINRRTISYVFYTINVKYKKRIF